MVEDIFIEDMLERGVEVTRSIPFLRYSVGDDSEAPVIVHCEDLKSNSTRQLKTRYLVGTDGAHSNVRKSIPGAQMVGESSNAKWGVLDGMVDHRILVHAS
jgi:2-polyprenyl-6-methoxyphenol hydroxylase-like FAD-dependent oxidoreductase